MEQTKHVPCPSPLPRHCVVPHARHVVGGHCRFGNPPHAVPQYVQREKS